MLVLQAVIISFFCYLANAFAPIGGFWCKYLFTKPLVGGLICGLVLGDLSTGIMLGAALQIAYLGVITVGGNVSMDLGYVSLPCIAMAMRSGIDTATAIALAATVAVLASYTGLIEKCIVGPFALNIYHKGVEEYNEFKQFLGYEIIYQVFMFINRFIPSFILIVFGPSLIDSLVSVLPEKILYALQVMGGILPAVGMAALLIYLIKDKVFVLFYVFGFALSVYLGLNTTAAMVIAAVVAVLYFRTAPIKDAANVAVQNTEEEL